ncbi:MAG: DUF2799 domain-containing protein [Gammaproteobacteria bacterium]|nr:DUF2799 domain-containing protein [Gammaproteobacteria bacterium]
MNNSALLLVWLAMMVTACASKPLDDCPSDDWNVIGYEDGKRGNGPYSARSLRKSCNDIATPFDEAAYTGGLQRGLQEYCTPDNGYALGRNGADLIKACTVEDEPVFREAHTLGLDHYKIDREIDRLRDELRVVQRDRRRTQDRLDDLRTGKSAASYGSYESERTSKNLMDSLSYYDKRIAQIKADIRANKDKIVEPPYYTGNGR